MAVIACIGISLFLILKAADWERTALENPMGYAIMLGILAVAAIWARLRTTAMANSEEGELQFEEAPEPLILALEIHKDGVLPISQ